MLLISEISRKNQILKQYSENKDEHFLMEECFMWTLEPQIWQDVGLLNYPEPPKEWIEYSNLSEMQRLKVDSEFFHQFAVKEYLAKKSSVYSHNYGLLDWLKQISKFFPRDGEHQVLHFKVDERLREFTDWFSNYSPEKEKLKKIFQAKEV